MSKVVPDSGTPGEPVWTFSKSSVAYKDAGHFFHVQVVGEPRRVEITVQQQEARLNSVVKLDPHDRNIDVHGDGEQSKCRPIIERLVNMVERRGWSIDFDEVVLREDVRVLCRQLAELLPIRPQSAPPISNRDSSAAREARDADSAESLSPPDESTGSRGSTFDWREPHERSLLARGQTASESRGSNESAQDGPVSKELEKDVSPPPPPPPSAPPPPPAIAERTESEGQQPDQPRWHSEERQPERPRVRIKPRVRVREADDAERSASTERTGAQTRVRIRQSNFNTSFDPSVTYNVASGDFVSVRIPRDVCDQLLGDAGRGFQNEIGGFLIGVVHEEIGRNGKTAWVTITDLLPIASAPSSPSHVVFGHEAWLSLNREFDRKYERQGKKRLGWYHTHPTQGIWFSDSDLDAHSVWDQWYQFGIVICPRKSKAGIFFWTDCQRRDELDRSDEFSLLPHRSDSPPSRAEQHKPAKGFVQEHFRAIRQSLVNFLVLRSRRLLLAIGGVAVILLPLTALALLDHRLLLTFFESFSPRPANAVHRSAPGPAPERSYERTDKPPTAAPPSVGQGTGLKQPHNKRGQPK